MKRQEMIYYGSLAVLFIGLFWQYGFGIALIGLGAVGVAVSVATSFFVTWLSERK